MLKHVFVASFLVFHLSGCAADDLCGDGSPCQDGSEVGSETTKISGCTRENTASSNHERPSADDKNTVEPGNDNLNDANGSHGEDETPATETPATEIPATDTTPSDTTELVGETDGTLGLDQTIVAFDDVHVFFGSENKRTVDSTVTPGQDTVQHLPLHIMTEKRGLT